MAIHGRGPIINPEIYDAEARMNSRNCSVYECAAVTGLFGCSIDTTKCDGKIATVVVMTGTGAFIGGVCGGPPGIGVGAGIGLGLALGKIAIESHYRNKQERAQHQQ